MTSLAIRLTTFEIDFNTTNTIKYLGLGEYLDYKDDYEKRIHFY